MTLPHVSVSLTTISPRVTSVARTLASLLAQDYPQFDVSLYISRDPFLLDQGIREVPPDIHSLVHASQGRLQVQEVPNIGSYRKLVPWLLSHQGHHRLVATADDDTIYPSEWLHRMVDAYLEHRCVVCFRGHRITVSGGALGRYREWMKSEIERNPHMHVLPTGKDGVLYHTSYFHPAVMDHASALALAPTVDDLWFKWHTAAAGVEAYCIEPNYSNSLPNSSDDSNSLYERYNKQGTNDEAIAKLHDYGIRELGFDMSKPYAPPTSAPLPEPLAAAVSEVKFSP